MSFQWVRGHWVSGSDLGQCVVVSVVCLDGSWDYVVLSTVRSLPRQEIVRRPTDGWMADHLGVVADSRLLNVAITRARHGLIIIGIYCIIQLFIHLLLLLARYVPNVVKEEL